MDGAAQIERRESGKGIDLQHAVEGREVAFRMFTPAIGRVGEPHGWRRRVACGAVVTHLGL